MDGGERSHTLYIYKQLISSEVQWHNLAVPALFNGHRCVEGVLSFRMVCLGPNIDKYTRFPVQILIEN